MTLTRPRIAAAAIITMSIIALSACSGGDDAASESPRFEPPEELAEPGNEIPDVTIKTGFSPYADELLAVAGLERGYFDDVGISVDPAPYGAEVDRIAAVTPLLTQQIQIGSGYTPAVAPQLDNVDDVVTFAIQDVFYGYRILAPEGKYTTVAELMDEGADYEDAVTEVMAQLEGQDVILRDGIVPTFYNLITATAGGSMADWNVSYLPNPDIVRAAQSGQADFVSPSGAMEISRLQMDGWEPIIELRQVIDNMPSDETISLRSTFSGYLTTRQQAEEDWETLLRFTSVIYRLIDDLEGDPVGTSADFVDYVNSYTGSSLTAEELASTFDGLYSVRSFEDAADFFVDEDSPFYFPEVAGAQIDELADQGVIGEGHGPSDLSIAGEVYDALVRYRAEADKLLGDLPDGELADRARAQYDARNYLDAYRLAAVAAEESGS